MKTNINANPVSGNHYLKVSYTSYNYNDESVYRTIMIGGNKTFEDLSNFIQNSFGFDKGHLVNKPQYVYSFDQSKQVFHGLDWEVTEDYTFKAEITKIGTFDFTTIKEIEFIFTYLDDFFFKIEILSVETDEQELENIKIIESVGENPNIDGPPEWEEENDEDEF